MYIHKSMRMCVFIEGLNAHAPSGGRARHSWLCGAKPGMGAVLRRSVGRNIDDDGVDMGCRVVKSLMDFE